MSRKIKDYWNLTLIFTSLELFHQYLMEIKFPWNLGVD